MPHQVIVSGHYYQVLIQRDRVILRVQVPGLSAMEHAVTVYRKTLRYQESEREHIFNVSPEDMAKIHDAVRQVRGR